MADVTYARRWTLLLSGLSVLALAACGTESAAGPAPADQLADRAAEIGVAPEMMYAVSLDGFAPAWQSIGVHGDSGYNAAYVSTDGAVAMLTVDPRGMTDADCPARPLATAADPAAAVECTAEGDGWYRVSGDQHEYVAVHDGVAVALGAGVGTVDREALADAVAGAHPPTADELDELFPPERGDPGGAPVDRGDLPAEGDGAPINYEPSGSDSGLPFVVGGHDMVGHWPAASAVGLLSA
ncbi:hypothetical protein [Jiangella asiatica]|uniref:Uncharacterized protein n=1 Tax=Jiangella asiatica TaxID=2530372 RepID=A0A4R5CSA4_9ACTN|nr:hypothetical protein [Jiangella asiatica]TDE02417.1 hypothetical protein E1269_21725 [Jiangella asiatica]